MAQRAHKDWHGKTDGRPWMQRTLIRMFRFIPLWIIYGIMGLVIPFYMLLEPKGYRASYRFYRRRLHWGPLRSFLGVYRNEFNLGKVVLDRFAMYAGKEFNFEIEGIDRFQETLRQPKGILLLGSHIGNYELAGYSIPIEEKQFYALVYSGETETVMKGRAQMFERTHIRMVTVEKDLSHLVILNNALSDGHLVSMHADRLFGSTKSISVPFLGENAKLPAGPFILSALKETTIFSCFVMKEGLRRYHVYLIPLEGDRDALAAQFASHMEEIVGKYPYQWYNFYDFWT